ncbi:MAG: CDP-alcohol phosphatidyltransferase family protein [Bacteroidales bacterium]
MNKVFKNIPNFLTILNLLSGTLAITFAATGDLYFAGGLVGIAAIFDFMDGFAARLLKTISPIGKQLDSLADVISFGLAPSFILHVFLKGIIFSGSGYLTTDLSLIGSFDLILLLSPFLLTVFATLRLAMFNLSTKQQSFFMGLPVPAMALFFVFAVMSAENYATNQFFMHEVNWLVLIVLFSALMVVPFPMFSLKFENYDWRGNEIQYIFIGISAILLVTLQTIGISLIIILYIFLSGLMNVLQLNK